jgi:hypothetical protein
LVVVFSLEIDFVVDSSSEVPVGVCFEDIVPAPTLEFDVLGRDLSMVSL